MSLALSPNVLADFFELSIDMQTVAGIDGYFKRVNPAFTKTLGYTEAELLGQPFVDFVHPEDREATGKEVEKLSFGIPTVSFENRYRCKNGDYKWLSWTTYPKGDVLFAIARDITVQKQAQVLVEEKKEHFRTILETVRDAVLAIDEKGTIKGANSATKRMLGYPEGELLGQNIKIIIKENYHDFIDALLNDFSSMEWQERQAFLEDPRQIEGLSHNKSIVPLEFLAHEMHFGGRRYFTIVLRDYSKRMRAELERKKLHEEVEAFIYAASHDLRAPLRHINGYVELLQEGALSTGDGNQKNHGRYLSMIKDVSSKMNQLLDSLLAFSHIGQGITQKSETDVNALVNEVIGEHTADKKSPNLRWKVDFLPLMNVNATLFRIVWQQLLSNAIKFSSRQKEPFIHIGIRSVDSKSCTLFVSDNGVGFDGRYGNQLFQMFRRLHTSREFDGLGVGLAQAKKIIELNGGKISAEGQVGAGATFTFSVPRV